MYNINDTVLYGNHGVCRIINILEKNFMGEIQDYYVLIPLDDEKSTIFVPFSNEKLVNKLRHILSVEEVHSLIKNMPNEETIWIENENLRREKYKEIIMNANRTELIKLIKTIYLHQQAQKEKKKKVRITDEQFLKSAEKMLYDEFKHVLNITQDEVIPFIAKFIENN